MKPLSFRPLVLLFILGLTACAQSDVGGTSSGRTEPDASAPSQDSSGGDEDTGGTPDMGGANNGADQGPECTPDPEGERCGDAIDNDCDGEIDEGFDTLGQECTLGTGACEASGMWTCDSTGLGVVCDAAEGTPTGELCGDGVDNDCDGEIDEGFETVGDTCFVGVGECEQTGMYACTTDRMAVECNATAGIPQMEICGNGLDEDCDGTADNGYEMVGTPCTVGVGACESTGTYVCTGLTTFDCSATPGTPQAEICGNGIDENCDGTPDDGFPNLGQPCSDVLNSCFVSGTFVCSGTTTACNAQIVPTTETCDGLDEDCDWSVDEDDVCGTCVDDSFEDNDFVDRAKLLASDTWYDLTSCFFNSDWFQLDGLSSAQRLVINTTFDHSVGDIDIRLYDAVGFLVGASVSTNDNEQISIIPPADGTYFLSVQQFNPSSSNPYRLYWFQEPIGACMDDAYEQNDDDAEATPFGVDELAVGFVCPSDPDFFDLGFISYGQGIRVDMVHSFAAGDLDLFLYREGSLVDAATSVTDDETITFWPEFSGDHTLVVQGATVDSNDYTVSVIDAGIFFCRTGDDAVEPDNIPGQAISLSQLSGRRSAICGDEDWVRMSGIQAGDEVFVSLRFADEIGDLDFFVYPDAGAGGTYNATTQVAEGRSLTDDEWDNFIAPQTGDYLIRIQGWNGAFNKYRVIWDKNMPCDDALEPNNRFSTFPSLAFGTSYPLQPATAYTSLTVCDLDYDNFELGPVGAGRTITATVAASSGNFEVEIFENLTSVAINSSTGQSTKTVTWTTVNDDMHTLAVRSLNGASVTYSLQYDID